MKIDKKKMLVSSLIIVMPILFGIIMWNKLPDNMPVHFDMNGNVDSTASKLFAVVALPLLLLALHILCLFITTRDPKHMNISRKVFSLLYYVCPCVSIYASFMMYGHALGLDPDAKSAPALFLGITIVIVGNYLPKSRQNYTVGIKIPWTLSSTENWNRTHRFAGRLWIVCGILIIIFGVSDMMYAMTVVAALIGILPMIYSYLFYKKEQGGKQ